jgi:hypothetical protein
MTRATITDHDLTDYAKYARNCTRWLVAAVNQARVHSACARELNGRDDMDGVRYHRTQKSKAMLDARYWYTERRKWLILMQEHSTQGE